MRTFFFFVMCVHKIKSVSDSWFLTRISITNRNKWILHSYYVDLNGFFFFFFIILFIEKTLHVIRFIIKINISIKKKCFISVHVSTWYGKRCVYSKPFCFDYNTFSICHRSMRKSQMISKKNRVLDDDLTWFWFSDIPEIFSLFSYTIIHSFMRSFARS